MKRPSSAALADEFEKIAAIADQIDQLRPGDILLTSKGSKKAFTGGRVQRYGRELMDKAMRPLLGDYVHAGIYVGDGKVIDANPAYGVKRVPLTSFNDASVKVMRPQLPKADRDRAIQHVQGMVGTAYSVPAALKAWATSTFKHLEPRQHVENAGVICSNLIANAYRGKVIPGKDPSIVLPGDFTHSSKLKTVLEDRR